MDRKTHTRWGPSVEDKNVSDGIPTKSTITSSHTPMNLEDLEKEAKDLDEELEKMIMKGGKHRVDLDAIEERSEKRKRIREAITQARKQTNPGYQTASHPKDTYQKEENRYRESKESNRKQPLTPYKPEEKEEYTVTVRDLKSHFKTEEEMYKHFIGFGDIRRISYMDGSRIGQRITPKKDVLVSYATEGGPLRAVHSKHRDIRVCIPDVVEEKDTFHEQRKLRHSKWHEENSQDSWGHSGRRYKEDKLGFRKSQS